MASRLLPEKTSSHTMDLLAGKNLVSMGMIIAGNQRESRENSLRQNQNSESFRRFSFHEKHKTLAGGGAGGGGRGGRRRRRMAVSEKTNQCSGRSPAQCRAHSANRRRGSA